MRERGRNADHDSIGRRATAPARAGIDPTRRLSREVAFVSASIAYCDQSGVTKPARVTFTSHCSGEDTLGDDLPKEFRPAPGVNFANGKLIGRP
jgi:hypothetical protein